MQTIPIQILQNLLEADLEVVRLHLLLRQAAVLTTNHMMVDRTLQLDVGFPPPVVIRLLMGLVDILPHIIDCSMFVSVLQ